MLIAVAGCVAQAEGEEIVRRAGAVDLVVGSQNYHRLPDSDRARASAARRSSTPNFRSRTSSTSWPRRAARRSRKRGISAFVTVQEGCDKFCTFCVVPYTRGAEMSRPVEKIVAEVERLAAAGVREVTLIGQNVNAYHGEGADGAPATLGRLLRRLAQVPGIARLRYTTSHPRDMDDDLIAAHGDLRRADAVRASAGAVRLRPHPGGDEPPPHARRLSRRHRAAARRARRPRLHLGFHRRLSRRDRGRFPRHAGAGRGGRLRQAPTRSNIRRVRARRRPRWTTRSRGRKGRAPAAAAGRDHPPMARLQRALRSAAPSRCCWKSRASCLGNWSAAPHICSRCRSWRRRAHDRCRWCG